MLRSVNYKLVKLRSFRIFQFPSKENNPLPRLGRRIHTLIWSSERKRKIPVWDLIKRGVWILAEKKSTWPSIYIRKAYPIYIREGLWSARNRVTHKLQHPRMNGMAVEVEIKIEGWGWGKIFRCFGPSSSPRITLNLCFPEAILTSYLFLFVIFVYFHFRSDVLESYQLLAVICWLLECYRHTIRSDPTVKIVMPRNDSKLLLDSLLLLIIQVKLNTS